MATSEQPLTSQTGAEQAAPPESERQHQGADSKRRVLQLVENIFGPSRSEQIQSLLELRNNARVATAAAEPLPTALENAQTRKRILLLCMTIWGEPEHIVESLQKIYSGASPGNTAAVKATSDVELKAAYERGRADLQAEIVFAERLAAVRDKYPDFDRAWASVRPLVPRTIWEEAADLERGLDGAYQLSKLPELALELSKLSPEKARERFRHFVKDLAAIGAL